MICPHCQTNLKYKERGGQTCGSCKKRFAVEPKDNSIRLHDMKLIRLSQQLGGNGAYRYTVDQLWYNASRKAVRSKGNFPLGLLVLTLFGAVGTTVIATVFDIPFLYIPPVVLIVGWTLYAVYRITTRRTRKIDPPMNRTQFHTTAVDGWRKTYGHDLPGLVRDPDLHGLARQHPEPVLVVLAPSRAAIAALRVNDVTNRYRVNLAYAFDQVPPNVPIALLHDLSVDGYRFAGQARATFGQRVVTDLTPRPKAARAAGAALKLRQPAPADDVVGWLRASGLLDNGEVDWLAKGWWTPIASVRPSNLVKRVEAAANRNTDPDTRKAAAIGFMSWPS